MQFHRSSVAAERLSQMSEEPDVSTTSGAAAPATLTLTGLSVGWPGATPTRPVTAAAAPGTALALAGRSGIGKTTLLLTIAGALDQRRARSMFGGALFTAADAGRAYALTPEDAHVFGTTVLENLRVARGDVTEDEAADVLTRVGLDSWLALSRRARHGARQRGRTPCLAANGVGCCWRARSSFPRRCS